MSDEPYTGDTSSYNLPRAEIAGCALVQDLLPLYIDGEVSPESHALIAAHLEQCERCSGFLAGARSVRSQILDEESKVRAAFVAAPAVAAVQQPVWSSPLATLWRYAMLLVWLVALAITVLGVLDAAPEGMVIGGFGTLAAIGGLLLAGGEQRPEWRLGMLLTGLSGLFCIFAGLVGIAGYSLSGMVSIGGVMQLAIAAWGLWPRRPRAVTQPLAAGPAGQPMLMALLSLAGLALCAGLILAGLATVSSLQPAAVSSPVMAYAVDAEQTVLGLHGTVPPAPVVEALHAAPAAPAMPPAPALKALPAVPAAPVAPSPVDVVMTSAWRWDTLLRGTILIGAGVAGLLLIADRRGWLPRELRGLQLRQWLGYGLVGLGLIVLSVALRALLAGLLLAVPSAGIAAAALLLGWALARRSPPPEEPRTI